MPRFFFHTANGEYVRDYAGIELSGRTEARAQAIRFIGDVVSDEPELLTHGIAFCVEVTDESSRLLFTVTAVATDAPGAGPAEG